MTRLVLFVPKAHCQQIRDFLRREKLLDKGSIPERDTKIGIPVICTDKDKMISILEDEFDLNLQDMEICDRGSQGDKLKSNYLKVAVSDLGIFHQVAAKAHRGLVKFTKIFCQLVEM
jgi:hypothetical protein